MKRKLEEDADDKIVYWWKTSSGRRIIAILTGLILLLIGSVGGLVYYKNQQENKNTIASGSVEQKKNGIESNGNSLNDENKQRDDSLSRKVQILGNAVDISIADKDKDHLQIREPKSGTSDLQNSTGKNSTGGDSTSTNGNSTGDQNYHEHGERYCASISAGSKNDSQGVLSGGRSAGNLDGPGLRYL